MPFRSTEPTRRVLDGFTFLYAGGGVTLDRPYPEPRISPARAVQRRADGQDNRAEWKASTGSRACAAHDAAFPVVACDPHRAAPHRPRDESRTTRAARDGREGSSPEDHRLVYRVAVSELQATWGAAPKRTDSRTYFLFSPYIFIFGSCVYFGGQTTPLLHASSAFTRHRIRLALD